MDTFGDQEHRALLEQIKKGIEDRTRRAALYAGTEVGCELAERIYASLPTSKSLLEKAKRIKREAIDQLQANLERFIEAAMSAGIEVHLVPDAATAVNLVIRLVRDANARCIVKTKSMTTEEIELRTHLEREGFDVVETDLGERIIQLADQRPSHLVAPAIHMTVQEVTDLFSRKFGRRLPTDPEQITSVARESLREEFLRADVGITGANFAIADSGAIVLVTNEGNARLVTALPKMTIAVFGVEKVVGNTADVFTLMQALIMSGAGRRMTSYVSMIKGGSRLAKNGQMQKQHYVIVDNGRMQMRHDPDFREALYCVRCGACNDICPTFRILGGHVFGHIYTGPMAIPWTAYTTGFDIAGRFSELCISCGLCRKACPEDIDLPLLIAKVKERYAERHGRRMINQLLVRYETFIRIASVSSPLTNFVLRRRIIRQLLERLVGIDSRRPFPEFTHRTFTRWFESHTSVGARKVAYFVDTFADMCDPEIGKSVIQVLEANDCRVALPRQKGSGMPAFLYGDIKATVKAARFNVHHLAEAVRDGYEVVSSEPTATYCLRELYPRLLRSAEAAVVAQHSHDFFEYLLNLKAQGEMKMSFKRNVVEPAIYYPPCHTRSAYEESPALRLLRSVGLDLETVRYNTCCGIAGTFGFKKGAEGYDVSIAIGETLFNRIKAMQRPIVFTESSVCKMQIEHGTSLRVIHPAIVLRQLYQK